MGMAFCIAAVSHRWTLLGVALISVQIGMGEASLLALSGKRGSHTLGAFASGTGLAGPFGYLWKVVWVSIYGYSVMLAAGVLLAVLYMVLVTAVLQQDPTTTRTDPVEMHRLVPQDETSETVEEVGDISEPVSRDLQWTLQERIYRLLRLWPYAIPLFVVYAAEYACQAGAWSAMGFPNDTVEGRAQFYTISNWLYQLSNFLARCLGQLYVLPLYGLWIVSGWQVLNLMFFVFVAAFSSSRLYQPLVLYSASFGTGLLGGTVYVQGYRRIIADIDDMQYREFALSSTCMAEATGVLVADVLSFYIQSCLYEVNSLPGAYVSCPL